MRNMIYHITKRLAILACSAAVLTSYQSFAQTPASISTPTYVTLADLGTAAPVVARVKVRESIPVKAERAPGVTAQNVRLYVEADVISLIRGRDGIGESVRYLVDVPRDSRGKAPKYKKRDFLIFARPVPGRPGEVQLIGDNAQQPWTPETDQRAREILRDVLSGDAPPDITGIREALHVPGNLQGEGETQIFLRTANNAPVSISILRRPGLRPQWAVSLSEIVDESAKAPVRDTLLWYKLACFLPRQLPAEALLSANDRANALARTDYQFVLAQLGSCTR